MTAALALDHPTSEYATARTSIADDHALLRAAVNLTRDLGTARPLIYWADFLGSAALGYAALFGAIVTGGIVAILSGLIAVLALYRAGSFIHEMTHIKHSTLPGFRTGYNAVVGVPLLVPSFLYEGVHTLHHARTRYGTGDDPEYLPLASMKPWSLPLFLVASLLAPVALLVRFAIVAPLSLFSRRLRAVVVARYSALAINPSFERRAPEGPLARQWLLQETATSLWSITLLALVIFGAVSVHAFVVFLAVASGIAVVNQVRTLVAHLWENEGEAMTVTAQYLDTVNVPPPALLPVLWAPVGLRYHALHHLLPSLPYHALAEAHRRLSAAVDPGSSYHKANYAGLPGLVIRLARGTMR